MSMRFSDGSQLPEQRRGEANPVAGLGEEGSASPVWRFEGLCPGAASSSNHDTLLPPSSHPLPHSRALLRIELSRHWPGAALSAPTDQDAPSPIASQPASRAGFSIGKSHFDRARNRNWSSIVLPLHLNTLDLSIRRWFALLGNMSNPNLAEVMGDGPASIADKLTLLPGYEPDFSAVTFCLKEEDHTLGNSLRYMIMKDPRVEFCGYSNPHPSENKIHLRVQMYGVHLEAVAASSSSNRVTMMQFADSFSTLAFSTMRFVDRASALDALRDAIENLDQLFAAIGEAYEKNLSAGNFEKHVEPKIDHDALAILAEEGKKRRAEEQAKLAESRAQAAAAAAGRPM
ncbi:hypothetical protein PaG_04897 [Moesziomyces aphidis]|uniref:DNA-directed RNA polymerase RBP11-like dimerisation domain-containing protein n=1 Tax=Moesziomyces aphidis TaxID=84754 RepID=W3VJI2_MOEAP|nr:hypothetical protein PaG_04897 [Moesziomyces aphidis]